MSLVNTYHIPDEIQHKVFLCCNYVTLQNTRQIQSQYTIRKTQYNTVSDCIANNNYDSVSWIIQYKHQTIEDILKYSHIQLLQHLLKILPNVYIFSEAAKAGNIETITNLFALHCKCDQETLYNTLDCEHFNNVSYLIANKCPIDYEIIKLAVEYNIVEVVEYSLQLGYVLTSSLLVIACGANALTMVQWLLSNNCTMCNEALLVTIRHEHNYMFTYILQYMVQINFLLTPTLFTDCYMQYSIGIHHMQSLLQANCPWNNDIFTMENEYDYDESVAIWIINNLQKK